MSQPATEAPVRARPAARQGNVFTRHIGPLPMWAWLAIAGGLVVAYGLYEAHKNSQAASATTANSSDVPPFVNQTYVSTTPPVAPTGSSGSPGTPGPAPDSDDNGPPPVSRKHRSPAVRHKIHQINQIHDKNEDGKDRKRSNKPPVPTHHVPQHPARRS